MAQDWLRMTAADLGRGIGAGEIDPVELAQTHLDAIAAHPLGQRIYARLTPERALAEAGAAKARADANQRRGLLDGVPISWKDLFDTTGVATEAGSALLAGRVPTADAEVLKNATAAGLVCLGKTHMSELAFSGLGYNPITATPPCVNDAGAVPGGSSSGAAASVAFGLAPAGIGSDTGGSVRIPAVWNDLIGMKTTSGRLSLDGVVPLCANFDTVGPLCRSVEDAGLLLAAMDGINPADLTGATLQGVRLMILTTEALDDLRPEPGAAFNSAIERLQAAGAQIDRVAVPMITEALALAPILVPPEAYGTWKDVIEAAPEKLYPEILKRFRLGANINAADYVKGWNRLHELRRNWARATAGYDAVLVPSAANLPPQLDRLISDSDYYITENLLALRNTRIGNFMGLCGLTLPTGLPSTGITLLGAPFSEERLLRVGFAAEAALA